jgi:hypothetical protein
MSYSTGEQLVAETALSRQVETQTRPGATLSAQRARYASISHQVTGCRRLRWRGLSLRFWRRSVHHRAGGV